MCMEVCGDSTSLNCHQIATNSIENWLEDCNAFELGHSIVQDQSSSTADSHCYQHRSPACVQNLNKNKILLRVIEKEVFWSPKS